MNNFWFCVPGCICFLCLQQKDRPAGCFHRAIAMYRWSIGCILAVHSRNRIPHFLASSVNVLPVRLGNVRSILPLLRDSWVLDLHSPRSDFPPFNLRTSACTDIVSHHILMITSAFSLFPMGSISPWCKIILYSKRCTKSFIKNVWAWQEN